MNFDTFKQKFQKVPVEHFPSQVPDNPMVSVTVLTYQHEPYIKDCLDGILMQETDFPFEVLLGEDGSTDGTREICIEYAKKYPQKIRLFLHDRRNNVTIDGFPTAIFNACYNRGMARGKYLAPCEGDDFWTDKKKLQKQIDLLEAHPEYSMTSHEAYLWPLHNKKSIRSFLGIFYQNFKIGGFHDFFIVLKDAICFSPKFWKKRRTHINTSRRKVSEFNEMMGQKWFMPTHSLVYRRSIYNGIPDYITYSAAGHEFMILYGLLFGKNYHFSDIMGVKRDQPTSMTQDKERKKIIGSLQFRNKVKRYEALKEYANEEQKKYIDNAISELAHKKRVRSKK